MALQSAARLTGSLLCAAAIAALLLPASAASVSAQTYYSIYGGQRNTPPTPYRDDRGRGETGNPFVDFFGALFGTNRRGDDDEDKKANAFAHHCVRTCDGKFFPVNRGGRKDVSLDKVCNAMCPASQTKVFSGLGIEQSVATDGQKYTAIPNAFAYRTRIVDNCTCNGRDPFGVVTVDFENDPTLQGGDIVVQETGFAVYRSPKDYVPIERSGMSAAFVKQLMAIKILPNNPHATHAMTVTIRQTPETPEFLNNKTSPETPAPNANAPAVVPPARTN